MFPPAFARESILESTNPGDLVCDPFSGRGTTLLEALLNDRRAIAADINPVAWCITAAKAKPAEIDEVTARLEALENQYRKRDEGDWSRQADTLPEFFQKAFHLQTLKQLLFVRKRLDQRLHVDRFILALLLGHLHGELNRSEYYLSNQMPHTISTKPDYSVRYWGAHNMIAPERDVFALLRNRAEFRLKDGVPSRTGVAVRSDVRKIHTKFRDYIQQVDAIITSPPYLDVTSFEEDQWLRLWLMGGEPTPTYGRVSTDDRHNRADAYWDFLAEAWRSVALLLKPFGYLKCRIGTAKVDIGEIEESLVETVRDAWPKARLLRKPEISVIVNRQTTRLNPDATGCHVEVDFTFVCAG